MTNLVVSNGDFVLFASGLVTGIDVKDPIGVDVKRDFDLGNATGSGRDPRQVELAQQMIVLGHGPLALVHLS